MSNLIKKNGTGLSLDSGTIDSLIKDMDTALTQVQTITNQLEPFCSEESLKNSPLDDLKKTRTYLNKARREAREAKVEFRRVWKQPMEEVSRLFEDELTKADKLLGNLKNAIDTQTRERQEAQKEILSEAYTEFCELNGFSELPKNVPFEKILDNSMLVGGKAWKPYKAVELVKQKAQKIFEDLKILENLQLFDKDAAKLYYFDCLEVTKTINYDKQLKESTEALEALKKEQEENRAFKEQETEKEQAEQEEEQTYLIEIIATPVQFNKLFNYCFQKGITHRLVKEVR